MKTIIIILAALLLASCSSNWRGEYYVVLLSDVRSLRQMYKDSGSQVFDLDQYPKGLREKLTAKCKKIFSDKKSEFVGDVRTPRSPTHRQYLMILTHCTLRQPIVIEDARQACTDLKMRLAWIKEKPNSFACYKPKGN